MEPFRGPHYAPVFWARIGLQNGARQQLIPQLLKPDSCPENGRRMRTTKWSQNHFLVFTYLSCFRGVNRCKWSRSPICCWAPTSVTFRSPLRRPCVLELSLFHWSRKHGFGCVVKLSRYLCFAALLRQPSHLPSAHGRSWVLVISSADHTALDCPSC